MKQLITLSLILVLSPAISQTVVNGNFESWTTIPYDEPGGWESFNREFIKFNNGIPASTKVSGQNGYAVKLETSDMEGEIIYGLFANTKDDLTEGEGGVPYSEQPTHITGYYKYDIQPGDSALLLVIFKKSALVISADTFRIGGTQSTFTSFSFAVNPPVVPDSVIIVAVSGDPFNETGIAGSTITFDELAFTGPGITQNIPGGNFDSWTAYTYNMLDDWATVSFGGDVTRTTDKYQGNYAAEIETNDLDGFVAGASVSTRLPFTNVDDTLVFYYKYMPQGNDSGSVTITLTDNGTNVGAKVVYIKAAATYTRMEIPFSAAQTPDTIGIVFSSSSSFVSSQNIGTRLLVDDVQFKPSPVNTGMARIFNKKSALVYPNPAQNLVNFSFTADKDHNAVIAITDVLGRTVKNISVTLEIGNNNIPANMADLTEGIYYYTVTSGGTVLAAGNFVKK